MLLCHLSQKFIKFRVLNSFNMLVEKVCMLSHLFLWNGDEGGSKDDKHLKHILLATVPHLFAFSDLPISIIEPVVNLIKSVGDGKKDQKRLLRALYYIIQVLLGMGKAGSTSAEQAGACSV